MNASRAVAVTCGGNRAANCHNPEITLNADSLQAICLECHNTIHYGSGGAVLRGLAFDENGNLIEGESV